MPIQTLQVTGTLNPDATGTYTYDRVYMLYRRSDNAYVIWVNDTVLLKDWYISENTIHDPPSNGWTNFNSDTVIGDYEPRGIYTGTATISEV